MELLRKQRKVGIIGVGHVGSHVASMLITRGLCEELVLIDSDKEKEKGQVLDLSDTAAYGKSRCRVLAGGYEAIEDADILVISASGAFFNENRLEELDESMEVIDKIAPSIEKSGFHGIIISITNPCDLVAYYLSTKVTASVIGSGTTLDSARFRQRIGNFLDIDCKSVDAWCLGEHGDSQVAVWSKVRIGTKSLEEVLDEEPELKAGFDKNQIEKAAVFAGGEIAGAKGSTEFGIGMAASELIKCILQDEKKILPCSVLLQGEYGEEDVYVSVPCTVGAGGVEKIWEMKLEKKEEEAFHKSCRLLKNYIETKIKR